MLGKGPFIFSVRATVPSSNIHFCKKDIELSKNSPIDLGEDKPGSGIKKSMPLLYAILLALGMLLIGGAAGWGITYWLNSSKETPVQPAPPQPTPAQTTPAQTNPSQPAPVQLVPNQPAPADPAATSDPANQSIGSSQANTIATTNNPLENEYNRKLNHIKDLSFNFDEIANS